MVDTALSTIFNWDTTRDMTTLEDKQLTLVDSGEANNSDTKQSYFGYYLGSGGETDSVKSSSPSDSSSSTKFPKSEITLNALQHEQNTLIEQRIQDRANNLRNMHFSNAMTPLWANYNTLSNRLFPNVEVTSQTSSTCLLPTQISSCMFGANRNVQWFSRSNFSTDPWATDYTQDPTMRSRPCFSSHQTRELEREFTVCQYVTRRRRIELAYSLNLTEKQIKTWFQNRRVKERKQKKLSSDSNDAEQHSVI